jgi:WD40 repeat protein
VTALELIDREHKLLSSSQDGTVKLWRTTDGMPLRDIPTSSPSEHVTSVAAIDRSRIVYSQADGYAYVVDLKSGRQLWSRRVHRYGVGVVAAAPVIRGFLTGDRYGWVDAWTEGGEGWESRRLGTPGDVVHGILLPAGGRHALAWDRSRQRMAAYDLLADDRQELAWNALFTGWDAAVLGLPDDRCAFPTPDDDGHAIAGVSVTSGERLFTLAGFDDVVTSLAATPGADTLAVGMQDGSVALCNVAADTSRMRLVGHAGPVVALRFFSERLLLSASLDFTLRLWDVTNAQALAVFGADGPLHRLIVTSSGHRVIVTELSGRMHVLHIQPGDSAATAR